MDYGHCNYFLENIINVRSVDQMRKQYDFKIKGVKVFAACNEFTRLPKPLQSRFRRLHLPPYIEQEFLQISIKVCQNVWRRADTEKFVDKCGDSDLKILLCEGTRIYENTSKTESDVETEVVEIFNSRKSRRRHASYAHALPETLTAQKESFCLLILKNW